MSKQASETNPFVQNGSFNINAVWRLEELMPMGTVSETQGGSAQSQFKPYKVETDDRVSIYTDGLFSWFPGLSTAAKDMFLYIASRLPYQRDVTELIEEKYCSTMNVSRSTFFSARKELINRIIVPRMSRKNTYWINPTYIFKGNRMEVYSEHVKVTNEHPFERWRKKQRIQDNLDMERQLAEEYGK